MPAATDTAAGTLLGEIGTTLGLSQTELARLFGVRRQATSEWVERGIPASRQAKAASIAGLCDLLRHFLRPERIPGIARTPAAVYGGLTMLEMIEQDRHDELRELTRESFDWNRA
jgi:hypothetical protein